MEILGLSVALAAFISITLGLSLCLVITLVFFWWVSPNQTLQKLKRCGFGGPPPSFPLGNIKEMKKTSFGSSIVNLTQDIHSTVSPYFSAWQKSYGKVFIYWVGAEPFLYIADPEFLKKMSTEVLAKTWGKPDVFRKDRYPMFGNGLVMAEGDKWVSHRHVIAPAFSPVNLKAMTNMMIESSSNMVDRWVSRINSGTHEIDVEKELIANAGEIIARASFGLQDERGKIVFEKLRTLQATLFMTNRYVGVPFGKFFCVKNTIEAKKLGDEIDKLLLSIIKDRMDSNNEKNKKDLLGLLLEANHSSEGKLEKTFSMRELVDECKTFFFGGYETTALSITWTLLLLAINQNWQDQLRNEIKEVVGDGELDFNILNDLKKMKMVMNEAVRLYPPSPNVQRQATEDIKVDNLTIPKGTNIWFDLVGMHRDKALWGSDANEFRPERFMDDANGGCNHKMGYMPFGFGGRMCVGRNLTFTEYKIVLTLLLSNFRFKISPGYHHSPAIMLSLRPAFGLPLIVEPL
ncbi:PREDICTED: cytokinin hydroxylase-like [Lupinus angustifolius]|nr:PREDICTED: cytokinin hydroxylase-like [Lupinus angustifolius]